LGGSHDAGILYYLSGGGKRLRRSDIAGGRGSSAPFPPFSRRASSTYFHCTVSSGAIENSRKSIKNPPAATTVVGNFLYYSLGMMFLSCNSVSGNVRLCGSEETVM